MANSDKNIVINPAVGSATTIPSINFVGAGNSTITLTVPDSSTGTLNFSNSNVNIFSIDTNLTSGTQLSVSDSDTQKRYFDVSSSGKTVLNGQVNISGKGLKLPSYKTSQLPKALTGTMVYDNFEKSLTVNTGTAWETYGSERYVKNGLILHLDPSRSDSYPGSGSTIYDISGNGYIGSMSNVGFSTDHGGSLTFNGSNSYIDLNTNDILQGYMPYTIEVYVKLTSTQNGEIFGNYGSGYTSNYLWFSVRYGHYLNGSNPYFASPNVYPLTPGYYYHIAVTRDLRNRNTVLYLNGAVNNTSTANFFIATGLNYRIGADVNGNAEPFGGNLYNLRVYNRALSPTEIQQNFNATRIRVGL
jgi:hypothetical protein